MTQYRLGGAELGLDIMSQVADNLKFGILFLGVYFENALALCAIKIDDACNEKRDAESYQIVDQSYCKKKMFVIDVNALIYCDKGAKPLGNEQGRVECVFGKIPGRNIDEQNKEDIEDKLWRRHSEQADAPDHTDRHDHEQLHKTKDKYLIIGQCLLKANH